MDWAEYVKQAKRTKPSDQQYDRARECLQLDNHQHLIHLLGVIAALSGLRITLGKLKKLIFSGKPVTFYEWEQHQNIAYSGISRIDREAMFAKLTTPEGISILHGAMGFADESLEVLEVAGTWLSTSQDVQSKFAEESGDTLWYQAILYDALGLTLPALCAGNIAKLAVRWPEKFDPENVASRDLGLESGAMMAAVRLDRESALIQEKVNEVMEAFAKGLAVPGDTKALVVKCGFQVGERIVNALRAHPGVFPFKLVVFSSDSEISIVDPDIADLLVEKEQARLELEAVRLERDMERMEVQRLNELLKEKEDSNAKLRAQLRPIEPPTPALGEGFWDGQLGLPFHSGGYVEQGLTVTIRHDVSLPQKAISRLKPSPDEIGSSAAPSRYNKPGRLECLDEIRIALGEKGFQSWLTGTIIKYAYRSGAKPGDIEKEMFYRQFLEHVAGMPGVADPRSAREGWTPAVLPLDSRDEQDVILQQYFPELR